MARFPCPSPSDRCRFGEETFAGTSADGRDALIADLPSLAPEGEGPTHCRYLHRFLTAQPKETRVPIQAMLDLCAIVGARAPHPSSTHLANGRYAVFTSPLRIIQVFQRAARMSQHHRPPKKDRSAQNFVVGRAEHAPSLVVHNPAPSRSRYSYSPIVSNKGGSQPTVQ
jgi:hypothetical protein